MKNYCKQGMCRKNFKVVPTTICSSCEDKEVLTHYFCDPRNGRLCFKRIFNKPVCKNKHYYLIIYDIIYNVSVLVLFIHILMYKILFVHAVIFPIVVILYRYVAE